MSYVLPLNIFSIPDLLISVDLLSLTPETFGTIYRPNLVMFKLLY